MDVCGTLARHLLWRGVSWLLQTQGVCEVSVLLMSWLRYFVLFAFYVGLSSVGVLNVVWPSATTLPWSRPSAKPGSAKR